jgi:hypothetical protein
MNGSVLRIAAAVLGLMLATPAVSFAADRRHPRGVNAREHHQTARIRNGIRNDALTSAERDRLKADEAAIRAEERVYRETGNGLNRREFKDLQHDLNQTSREIYRAKHNDRNPPPQ